MTVMKGVRRNMRAGVEGPRVRGTREAVNSNQLPVASKAEKNL